MQSRLQMGQSEPLKQSRASNAEQTADGAVRASEAEQTADRAVRASEAEQTADRGSQCQ